MQYHPDRNPDVQFTSARFIEIQEAYQVLSDARRRAQYDDDRWLNGMGRRNSQPQTISPAWLLDIAVKLNKSLATMDTHRISHGALSQYIMLLLSDAHIDVLLQHNEADKNSAIITEVIKATRWLEAHYLSEIINKLLVIAPVDEMKATISNYHAERQRGAKRDKLFPYIVILITLALCVVMYFYGSK